MCGEVVEQQAAHRDLADVGQPGGHRQMIERRVLGMERQRNEGLEAAGFILHGAQLQQVVDAVFVVLDVAVEHGGIRPEAQLVGQARGLQPFAAVDLVVADDGAHARREDLRAAAGHGIDAGIAQLDQRFFDGELGAAGEERDLDHGEGLDVDLGKALLQAADQVEEVFERQVGMQAADDVELGDCFGVAGGRRLPGLFESHGVAGRVALLAAKGAELAGRHADVGGVDVAIDVEVGHVAVHPLAHVVGQPADGQHVGRSRRAQGRRANASRSPASTLAAMGSRRGS